MTRLPSSPNVDQLMQTSLAATAAAKSVRANAERPASLKLVSGDSERRSDDERRFDAARGTSDSGNRSVNRAPWRQRLVDAERGMAHALRSESTLLGYGVLFAVTALAAGVLQLPGIQLVILGFVAVLAAIIELVRIAIRELSDGTTKAVHVASAASLLAASTAGLTTIVVIGLALARTLQ